MKPWEKFQSGVVFTNPKGTQWLWSGALGAVVAEGNGHGPLKEMSYLHG